MAHFYSRISFVIGLVLGVILAVYFKNAVEQKPKQEWTIKNVAKNWYNSWFYRQNVSRKSALWDEIRYSNKSIYTESQYLFEKVKVLCIILTKTLTNFNAANNTWAKGCNSIAPIYLETQNKVMPSKRNKENSSWVLLCKALQNINSRQFHWILVMKDSTFAIMENLRYYVAPLNPRKQHYLGHAVKFWSTSYNSGDAGYILSIGSVKAFQKKVQKDVCMENSYWNREDYYLGKYLSSLNITPKYTADEEGLSMFHPYNWYHVFNPGENYYKSSIYPVKCCSKRSITFQAVEGDKMYTFDYLFYKLQIFIYGNRGNTPNRDLSNDDEVWKGFLKERDIHDENISSEHYYKLWEDLINDPTSFAQNMKKENLFDYE